MGKDQTPCDFTHWVEQRENKEIDELSVWIIRQMTNLQKERKAGKAGQSGQRGQMSEDGEM